MNIYHKYHLADRLFPKKLIKNKFIVKPHLDVPDEQKEALPDLQKSLGHRFSFRVPSKEDTQQLVSSLDNFGTCAAPLFRLFLIGLNAKPWHTQLWILYFIRPDSFFSRMMVSFGGRKSLMGGSVMCSMMIFFDRKQKTSKLRRNILKPCQ